MQRHSDSQLDGRERTRLRRAREDGFLNARRQNNQNMVKAYSAWCWRLKIPMVWFERRTPRSRFGRVHLDMFTTANTLTDSGQAQMKTLWTSVNARHAADVSPHDASWDRVLLQDLDELAHAAFRAAIRTGSYEPNRNKIGKVHIPKSGELIEIGSWRSASA